MALKPLLPHQPVTTKGDRPSNELLEALQIIQREEGRATWGLIDGTLSDQTDLQAALNGKAADVLFTDTVRGLVPPSGGGTSNFLRADGTFAAPPVTPGTDLNYDAATRLLSSSTGADVTLPLFTSTDAGLVPASGGGTTNFLRADGTWAAPPAGGSVALNDLTDVTITGAAEGQSLIKSSTDWVNQTAMTVTLGPFYINDMAGTATTDATLGYFNTATAVSGSANEIKMQTAGRVVGVIITSDAARTAGTATVAVEVNNTTQAFNAGAVALDATNTTSDSSFVAWGSGVAFNAGDTLGCEVTTSGWTPTTANFSIWLVVMLKF